MLLAINLLQAWGRRRLVASGALMAAASQRALPRRARLAARAATRSRTTLVRWLFISVSLAFLAALLFAPLATVFAMALEKGLAAYLAELRRPGYRRGHPSHADHGGRGRAAQHHLRPRRGLGHRQVRIPRQELPDHADRPAAGRLAGDLGHDLRAAVRPAGLVRRLAAGARHQHHLRAARASSSPPCS